ncbi:MAG: SpoIIE family protein phosphatase [Myxococcales bacterium]|nr:SpoIIE family protein phosphatase [Myxococcales bacterium]MCB9643822.1 SpoIIE family protein phosphatase [Myxococcales bacterium]
MFVFIQQRGPDGRPMTRLLAESGPLAGRVFRIEEAITSVGRDAKNQIVLPFEDIAPHHLELRSQEQGISLRALEGEVQVNSKTVREAMLQHGDRIGFVALQKASGASSSQEGEGGSTSDSGGAIFLASQEVRPITDDVRTLIGSTRWGAISPMAGAVTPLSRSGIHATPRAVVADRRSPQERMLEILLAVSKALSRPEDIEQKVQRVLELLFDTMEIDRAALLILGAQTTTSEAARLYGESSTRKEAFHWSAFRDRSGATDSVSLSSTIIARVLREEKAVLTQDAQREEWLDGARSVLGQEIRTCICTPLKTANGVLGVLYADSNRPATSSFTKQDLDFFTAFANQAATAIENARLLQIALEKERFEQDIRLAQQIQRSLFPKEIPHLLNYQLVGESMAMEQVGGDYFDYLMLDEHHLALVVADVSGHGVSSGLIMTMTRSVLRASLQEERSPAQILLRVNQLVSEDMLPRMFVTMLLLIVDLRDGHFVYASAGHDPLLHYQASSHRVQRLKAPGSPLGMSKWARLKPRYRDAEGTLLPHDSLLLYTDGITETANAEGHQFEMERLEALLQAYHNQPAEALLGQIFLSSARFRGPLPPQDDCTIILLKRLRDPKFSPPVA